MIKNKLFTFSVCGVLATASSFAIEIPVEEVDAQKKKIIPLKQADEADPMPKVEVKENLIPYLGVAGNPVSELLADHLKLENGVALHTIAENSPASRSGLLKNDILVKLGGVDVKSQREVRNVIRGAKVGAEIDALIYRKGEKVTQKLTLGAMPADLQAGIEKRKRINPLQAQGGPLNLQMKDAFEQLRKLNLQDEELDDLLQDFNGFPKRENNNLAEKIQKQLQQQIEDQLKKQLFNKPEAEGNKRGFMKSSISQTDEHGTLTLESENDGAKMLTARDKEGNIVFQGPFTTKDDKAAVPEAILKRANKLGAHKGMGALRMEFNIR